MALHIFSLTDGAHVVDLSGAHITSSIQWHMTNLGPSAHVLQPTNPLHVIRFGWVGLGGYTGIGSLQYISFFNWMSFEYEFHSLPTPNIACFTYWLFPACTADLWLDY